MDRLEAMRVFALVAELGGFSDAARRLDVSPAHVSKAVAKLEAHLGVRLLNRTTRRVSLTSAGSAYLDRARGVLAEFDALEEGVRAAHAEPAGLVRVSAPIVFGAREVTPLVLSFLEAYPRVDVRLSLADRMVDLVDEGFDLAVRIGNLADSSLVARRLAASSVVLVAARGHPALTTVRAPADLEAQACVVDTNISSPQRWVLERDGEVVDVRVNGRLWVNSAEATRQAVLAGFGVGLLPGFVADVDLEAGRLAPVLPEWRPSARDVWAVFPQNRMLAARVRLFIDHLADGFAQRDRSMTQAR